MKTMLPLVLLSFAVFAGSVDARPDDEIADRVSVEYVNPGKFSDVRYERFTTERERQRLLTQFAAGISKISGAYLQPGLRLDVKISQFDMAGNFEPWHSGEWSDVRILKDIYPPHINLAFRLSDRTGKVLKEGERKLTDLGYLSGAPFVRDETFPFEYKLYRDWLRSEFRTFRKS